MGVEAAAVDAAYERLSGVVARTPLQPHQRASTRTGAEVWLKREDLQLVRSYKLRGAYNLLAQLDEEQRDRMVVCASAGNHAQGVAFACRELDLRAKIFIPRTTPRQKRARIALLGGDRVEIIVGGDTYDAAFAAACEQAERSGAVMVPAFDHPDIIAGQGTVAREIVEQLGRAPDAVVVPIGGGGLVAGITAWFAKHHPATRVIGVEPAGAASMAAAVAAGGPIELAELDGFVDGAAVRKAGTHTYGVLEEHPVELREVDPGVLCEEMLDLFDVDGVIAEPAGALAPAALRAEGVARQGETVIAVVSGGNHDVSRYAEVMERALVSRGVKHYFLVEFPQEPGALRRFLDQILGPDDDIALFEYVKRTNREFGPALVGLELGAPEDLAPLLARLEASPLTARKLSPDDPMFRFLV
ncbi:threonine ammonia-lyase IlvA [Amycolatopsis alkalitolerans]|uniref:L-threonine dehydratase n=1 Tax=Amycolatopsis alkalitolerans TaxID=2547244 RepID=A0A5C4M6Z9_9PSEU|nr:threonine ammonia-lyase IlvA [Amycolatopsis alkalitolerans]TNC27748.1 threonine ammonia-lyase IlvA [Amycolatopsis alkalitolerans]